MLKRCNSATYDIVSDRDDLWRWPAFCPWPMGFTGIPRNLAIWIQDQQDVWGKICCWQLWWVVFVILGGLFS